MASRSIGRNWNLVIKSAAIIVFVSVIGFQLLHEKDTSAMWQGFVERFARERLWILLIACLLMPVSWMLEAEKWKMLMRPALGLTRWQAAKAVMGGVALSVFTPNRIGEYGGRMLFVPSEYNWRAVFASLVGSFAQNLVHVTCGVIGASLLLSAKFGTAVWLVAGAVVCGAFYVYFHIRWLSKAFSPRKKPKWLAAAIRNLHHLEHIRGRELALALVLAFFRYVVFSTQFVLLLYYFGLDVPVVSLYAGVAVMFLVQTGLPLPPFLDVVVRSEAGIVAWTGYAVNELTVLGASFFLWIINVLIPAFFGMIAISTVNVLKSLGYEKKTNTTGNADIDNGPVVESDVQ